MRHAYAYVAMIAWLVAVPMAALPAAAAFYLSMMKASERGERGSPEALASSPPLPVRLVRPSPAITTGRTRCNPFHHGSAWL